MGTLAERYRGPADLPQRIPFFPLRGAILLPRARLPLNVFEPRYLAMLDDVMSTSRVLGIVQPVSADSDESPAGKTVGLRRVGCVGRVTAYQELDDGRLAIVLTGIARCTLEGEAASPKPYRICTVDFERFSGDFIAGSGENDVDRQSLLAALKTYLEARQQRADWSAISKSPSEIARQYARHCQSLRAGGEAGAARGPHAQGACRGADRAGRDGAGGGGRRLGFDAAVRK